MHVFLLRYPNDNPVRERSQVESVCFVNMGKCYQISAARNCFQELLPLLATCSATYAAVQVHTARRFRSAPDHAFVITCKHLDARVALQLHGPIEDALQNRKPEGVGIGVLDGRGSIPTPGFESAGFKDLFDRMIHPYVIKQFERGRLAIQGRFSADRTKWPPPWQMGWLIRNGLAHGGMVHFFDVLGQQSLGQRQNVGRALTQRSPGQGEDRQTIIEILAEASRRQLEEGAGFSVRSVPLEAIEAGGGSLRCCVAEIF